MQLYEKGIKEFKDTNDTVLCVIVKYHNLVESY